MTQRSIAKGTSPRFEFLIVGGARKRLALVAMLALAVAPAGCKVFETAPPPHAAGPPAPPVLVSTVVTPASIDAEALRQILEAKVRSQPLADERTDEFSARVLVNEKSIIEEPRQIVETPYRAASCTVEKVPEQITERVKAGVETFRCALSPWDWGNCARDVFKNETRTIWKDVTNCVPEQVEVVKMVMTPVVHLHEAVTPTSACIRYRADVESLAWRFSGDRIELIPRIRVRLALDVKQGFLTANTTLRGIATCESVLTPTAKARLALKQAGGTLQPDVRVDDVSLEVNQLCVPGVVESIDPLLVANPVRRLIADQLTRLLNDELTKVLNDLVDDEVNDLDLTPQVVGAADSLRSPFNLGNGLWLTPGVEQVRVGQLAGMDIDGRTRLTLGAGVVARPRVVLASSAPPTAPAPSIGLGAAGDAFSLYPEAVLPLSEVSARANTELRRLQQQLAPRYGDVRFDVDVYQSGERVVLAIRASRITFLNLEGTVYMTARVNYDGAGRMLSLIDFRFDPASREALERWAKWGLSGEVERTLDGAMRFPLEQKVATALAKLSRFESTSNAGTLTVRIDRVGLHHVWLDQQTLHVVLAAQGVSAFAVDPAGLN